MDLYDYSILSNKNEATSHTTTAIFEPSFIRYKQFALYPDRAVQH